MFPRRSGTHPKSLVIVQPYVPSYRYGFFSKLVEALAANDIQCRVAAGVPDSRQSARADAIDADWIMPYRPRVLRVGDKMLGMGGARPTWNNADAVIIGHLGSSLDTYLAIADSKLGRIKVGLWGHIKSYVNDPHPLDAALEKWQLHNADHVFAYSPGGQTYSVSVGVPPERVTTVMNATDTAELAQIRKHLSSTQIDDFAESLALRPKRTFGFIGGIDDTKRIDFLVAVLDRLWLSDPDVRILIGGLGNQSELLKSAADRGQAIMLGRVDATGQALIASAASALLIPGRIGLVAVDALVLGIPILTTAWGYHAPESEYLLEGESRFTSEDDVEAYVALVRQFLRDLDQDEGHRQEDWPYPTIDSMVANFSSGVEKMFARDHSH